MNEELILQHGLTLDEFQVIRKYLNRDLSIEELGIFSAMWNEHCCYKTSKKWLKKLPTDNEICLLYTSPSPRDRLKSRMPSSA